MTNAQLEIVLVLNDSGPCTMHELGELLLLNRDPFRSVDSLEAKGLVERGAREDKRKTTWGLSEDGAAAAEKITAADLSVLQENLGRLSEDTATSLVAFLQELSAPAVMGNALRHRFGAQQTSVSALLAAGDIHEVQTNRSAVVASRLQTVVGILDAGDHEQTYARFESSLMDLNVGLNAWDSLFFRGGPVSISTLESLSLVVTGDSKYLLSENEPHVRETESRLKAEVALSLAGVTDFGGRGTLDSDALQALAELVQKRLGNKKRG